MERFHLHVSATNRDESIRFYSTLFAVRVEHPPRSIGRLVGNRGRQIAPIVIGLIQPERFPSLS
jgi:hypothetical protein